mgnify:CR=1 FL=1
MTQSRLLAPDDLVMTMQWSARGSGISQSRLMYSPPEVMALTAVK